MLHQSTTPPQQNLLVPRPNAAASAATSPSAVGALPRQSSGTVHNRSTAIHSPLEGSLLSSSTAATPAQAQLLDTNSSSATTTQRMSPKGLGSLTPKTVGIFGNSSVTTTALTPMTTWHSPGTDSLNASAVTGASATVTGHATRRSSTAPSPTPCRSLRSWVGFLFTLLVVSAFLRVPSTVPPLQLQETITLGNASTIADAVRRDDGQRVGTTKTGAVKRITTQLSKKEETVADDHAQPETNNDASMQLTPYESQNPTPIATDALLLLRAKDRINYDARRRIRSWQRPTQQQPLNHITEPTSTTAVTDAQLPGPAGAAVDTNSATGSHGTHLQPDVTAHAIPATSLTRQQPPETPPPPPPPIPMGPLSAREARRVHLRQRREQQQPEDIQRSCFERLPIPRAPLDASNERHVAAVRQTAAKKRPAAIQWVRRWWRSENTARTSSPRSQTRSFVKFCGDNGVPLCHRPEFNETDHSRLLPEASSLHAVHHQECAAMDAELMRAAAAERVRLCAKNPATEVRHHDPKSRHRDDSFVDEFYEVDTETGDRAPLQVDVVIMNVNGTVFDYAAMLKKHRANEPVMKTNLGGDPSAYSSRRHRDWNELMFALRSIHQRLIGADSKNMRSDAGQFQEDTRGTACDAKADDNEAARFDGLAWIRRIVIVSPSSEHLPFWMRDMQGMRADLKARGLPPVELHTDKEVIENALRAIRPDLNVSSDEYQKLLSRYYPSFNSNALESVLPYVPGLSRFFLYMNNDMMFARDVSLLHFTRPMSPKRLRHDVLMDVTSAEIEMVQSMQIRTKTAEKLVVSSTSVFLEPLLVVQELKQTSYQWWECGEFFAEPLHQIQYEHRPPTIREGRTYKCCKSISLTCTNPSNCDSRRKQYSTHASYIYSGRMLYEATHGLAVANEYPAHAPRFFDRDVARYAMDNLVAAPTHITRTHRFRYSDDMNFFVAYLHTHNQLRREAVFCNFTAAAAELKHPNDLLHEGEPNATAAARIGFLEERTVAKLVAAEYQSGRASSAMRVTEVAPFDFHDVTNPFRQYRTITDEFVYTPTNLTMRTTLLAAATADTGFGKLWARNATLDVLRTYFYDEISGLSKDPRWLGFFPIEDLSKALTAHARVSQMRPLMVTFNDDLPEMLQQSSRPNFTGTLDFERLRAPNCRPTLAALRCVVEGAQKTNTRGKATTRIARIVRAMMRSGAAKAKLPSGSLCPADTLHHWIVAYAVMGPAQTKSYVYESCPEFDLFVHMSLMHWVMSSTLRDATLPSPWEKDLTVADESARGGAEHHTEHGPWKQVSYRRGVEPREIPRSSLGIQRQDYDDIVELQRLADDVIAVAARSTKTVTITIPLLEQQHMHAATDGGET